MPEPIQSCFRRSISGVPTTSTFSGDRTTTTTTSIYNTHLGPASFTWSSTFLSLSLQISLPTLNLSFNIRPRILLKAKGSKHLRRSMILVAWDLTGATFHSSGGPEPLSRFYVAISVSGEMLVVAGDMAEEAHRKMRARRGTPAMLVSRKDRVFMRSGSYRTAVIVSGKERGVLVEIGGKGKESVGLAVGVDGMRVLEVRRIGWKFRGREKVEIGGRIQISWNLCGWLFPAKEREFGGDAGGAVFVFVFEGEEEEGKEQEEEFGGEKKRGLLKTRSSSSSSSASSAGSSSVMDWASLEEEELRGGGGFTLVIHAWKS